ncbi:LysR family transcriptional regulator [Leucobacter sp. 1207-22]|uniref:LysR family transcriptional regulator n=1 Tax=Leucobacter sp. 1207-22 TaxID=2604456 RepID=UPI004062F363
MNVIDLKGVDLNLLVVFHTLMQERNVTRAAEKLHLTQSAVSAALSRLRAALGDPLFERGRGEMTPTPHAVEIAGAISSALGGLSQVFHPKATFDPVTSTRTFHLAMSDDIEAVVAPWLLRRTLDEGWRVRFAVHQTNSRLYEEALATGGNDVAICVTPLDRSAAHRVQPMFAGSWLCLYASTWRQRTGPITRKEFAEVPHIRVSFDAQRGFIDDLLESATSLRHMPLSITHFAGLGAVLKSSPAIATLPDYAARAFAAAEGLRCSPVPVPVPAFTVSMVWRAETDSDPALAWLREVLGEFTMPNAE